jgi:hypothetical protein
MVVDDEHVDGICRITGRPGRIVQRSTGRQRCAEVKR